MAHHKKKPRVKKCWLCVPWKLYGNRNSFKHKTRQQQKAILNDREQRKEAVTDSKR